MRLASVILIIATAGVGASALAQVEPEPRHGMKVRIAEASDSVRFVPIQVHLDPAGSALAAWQFELTCDDPAVRIAGIEGSDHAAFNTPPYYDPAAMRGNRVVAASFKVAPADRLPAARVRVATVMVSIPAGSTPSFTLDLNAAADPAGQPLPNATASIQEGTVR